MQCLQKLGCIIIFNSYDDLGHMIHQGSGVGRDLQHWTEAWAKLERDFAQDEARKEVVNKHAHCNLHVSPPPATA